MTRDQFVVCARLFAGTTIRDLRHIRDVPRASMLLARPRRPTAPPPRLPLRELEDLASAAHART